MRRYKEGAHSRYKIRYHFVWCFKYRRIELKSELRKRRLREIIEGISERYEFDLDTLGIDREHVHVFIGAPPRYSPSQIANVIKSISGQKMYESFPEIREELWGGEMWADGYFVRTVGDEVTEEVIREYVREQGKERGKGIQLELF